MSLINKMLQDLDARGTPAADAFPSNVRPVAQERRAPALRLAGVGAGLAIAGVAGVALAWFGWHHSQAARPVLPAASKPVAIRPAPGLQGSITPAPAAAKAPPPQIAPAGAVQPQMAAPALAPEALSEPAPAAEPKPTRKHHAEGAAGASAPRARAPAREDGPAASAAASRSALPMEPDSPDARAARHAAAIELATREARLARLARLAGGPPHAAVRDKPRAGAKVTVEAEGRQDLPAQQAENAYRRALASLQDGRMSEAVASLQLALRIDPGHDAARQTLVGLLVESGRTDDAIRELQLGLARDPAQPALAMLLARLQIERGGSGIETLQRTLPYAANGSPESAEYRAFLAGALERQQRHREAVEQYQQALRSAPGNGVWWMGLGLALQADKRNAEALDAYQRARASGSLNAELQGFVERRVQQLGL